jgi:hypothetical protein
MLTAVLMVALAAASIGWSMGRSDGGHHSQGGVPDGWVLSGDLSEGLATLMPANPNNPPSDVEAAGYLETTKARGFTVTSLAPHEFRLVRLNPSR